MELTCGMPIPGGCAKPAREVVIAYPSIDQAGPMAQWNVHLRCGLDHDARTAARAIRKADPGSTVLAFTTVEELETGIFAAMHTQALA